MHPFCIDEWCVSHVGYMCYVFVCLVSSIGEIFEHEGREKKKNLRCSRIYGQNSPEINENKKKFLDSAPVFEHEQNGFCGVLENYSSFRTRKRSSN